jgi:hypothetical protein
MSMILTFARTWGRWYRVLRYGGDSAWLTLCAMACAWRVADGSATNRH